MAATSDGDKQRLEQIYRAHADSVHAYAVSRVGWSEAPDVVADTFLVAWRRIAEVPEEPVGWLLGTARRVIATRTRSSQRRANLMERLRQTTSEHPATDPAEMLGQDLLAAMSRLSEADQETLLSTAWFDLSAKQAAAVHGCSPATYHVRLHRARHRLRRELNAIPSTDGTPRDLHPPMTTSPRKGSPS